MNALQLVVSSNEQVYYWAAAAVNGLANAPGGISDLTSRDYDSLDEARTAAREAVEEMLMYVDNARQDWMFLDCPMSYSAYAELVGVSPILD